MKKITFVALLFCTSLVFAETDPQVKPGDATENTENAEIPETLTFTDEPLEEEVVEDEAFLELLKTALIPELHPLDEANGATPAHISLSFVSDEEISKPQVEAFRKMYLSPKWSALLRGYLESAMEYRLYVRKAVQDAQMPEMLEYLPVVESNYKTNAKSRSGAIGMWQFMANSVWPFLTLNDFVDERLDPWKSTDAALKKLTDNYNIFNDWLLAIGAYNCGVGAMNRAIKKAGGVKDFWYLAEHGYLSKQTADYVPKLIAIADLAINSQYYGIDIPDHKEEFDLLENEKNGNFDYLTVNKAYSLNQLAQEMRMDTATLKRLNPSYTLGMTHPSKKSEIRLPLGMKESAEDALANLKPVDFPLKYTVVAGDSLWSISRKYKTTVSAICELNGIKENAILKIGKILYIPSK
jgi:membrane-bound lytic murein transglycosylase D